ncbi:cobalamin-binding protein [Flavilitoribacter nigricans]|uniref:Cobalamin-binding protein n=1 Tax=Flavilitoribacter nigricans (strain ATCC 23147 / DSM 23189 / NBRC 102662 / NCIMB 1420 / SS-2) TaxID=1122177 RepID=A0A2D0N8K7_FLAN2|nr:cobalamin-binding protein [Flavilitoribacter nigricans]PHN04726.1 cobalamin-binding protein [Flavilitoribacter nigricans DSM 23189 = NBRC 102662]
MFHPQRIVCLTEETTEWLYLLGAEDRIVGISAYTERPPRAKQEKPVVSAFIGGSVQKIKALEPDLIIGFSDVQADLARDLIRENLQVFITNQRSVTDILNQLLLLGRMIGAGDRAEKIVKEYRERIDSLRRAASERKVRPRVYFEEWDDPMISAIHWVSELIGIAGGQDIFADRASGAASRERHVRTEEVIDRAPDIYISCWCGKPLDRQSVLDRPGFDRLPAIQNDRIYEMDPAIILQPGPACLTDGLDALLGMIND